MDKYFLHQIRGHQETIDNKGIVVADTIDSARQGYHAYLGAYAYGNNADTDFVSCMITNQYGGIEMSETWNRKPEPNA
jgi:uncharacterized protein (DUF305 family)